jgi:hypothetical protein
MRNTVTQPIERSDGILQFRRPFLDASFEIFGVFAKDLLGLRKRALGLALFGDVAGDL